MTCPHNLSLDELRKAVANVRRSLADQIAKIEADRRGFNELEDKLGRAQTEFPALQPEKPSDRAPEDMSAEEAEEEINRLYESKERLRIENDRIVKAGRQLYREANPPASHARTSSPGFDAFTKRIRGQL